MIDNARLARVKGPEAGGGASGTIAAILSRREVSLRSMSDLTIQADAVAVRAEIDCDFIASGAHPFMMT